MSRRNKIKKHFYDGFVAAAAGHRTKSVRRRLLSTQTD
jgi:hypothetical protein